LPIIELLNKKNNFF